MDHSSDFMNDISRLFLIVMFSLLSKAVSGYYAVKDKYLQYTYSSDKIGPHNRYLITDGKRAEYQGDTHVPYQSLYIEEWIDSKGRQKNIVLHEGDEIPTYWTITPFQGIPARCPWVWIGDIETEVDLTNEFDLFLVAGNKILSSLVQNHTHLIYIETGTLKEIEFPSDGITIEEDVD